MTQPTQLIYYVLHSPYPDGSWRGVEKCATTEQGTPRLFESEEAASEFLAENGLADLEFVVVPVVLCFPDVRQQLTEWAKSQEQA